MEREPGKELERARKIQQEPELERKRAPGVPDDAPGDTAEDAAGISTWSTWRCSAAVRRT